MFVFNFLFVLLLSVIVSVSVRANVIGSDVQNFNPTTDGLDFVTVHSVRTLRPGLVNIGAFLDYASNPLPDALGVGQNKYHVSDKVLSADLHFGLGLTERWSIGLAFSSLLSGTVDNSTLASYFQQQGLTDIRGTTKFRFYSTKTFGLAGVLTANLPQLQNDPFYGGSTNSIYDFELASESQLGSYLWAVNLGYRLRNPGSMKPQYPYEPVGNEVLASTALAKRIGTTNWTGIGELYAGVPVASTTSYSQSQLTSLEALAGVKYFGIRNINFHGGVAAAILHGIASPDYRLYIGLNWTPGYIWGRPTGAKPAPAETPLAAPIPESPVESAVPNESRIGEPAADIVAPPVAQAPVTPPPVVQTKADDLAFFDRKADAKIERFAVREINFRSGSSRIPASFRPFLEKFGEYLKRGARLQKLTIYGYTDSSGSAILNQELSVERAGSVKRALTELFGVDASKIEAVGMGPAHPIATNKTADGRSRNRRVEFQIERE